MGCGCGGKSTKTQESWQFRAPNGQTRTYDSKLQADAAKIREGGGTVTQIR